MSYFRATCPRCGETYTHLYIGSTMHAGHRCPPQGTDEKTARAIESAVRDDVKRYEADLRDMAND
jgi:hypothetical protein